MLLIELQKIVKPVRVPVQKVAMQPKGADDCSSALSDNPEIDVSVEQVLGDLIPGANAKV